MAQVLTDFSRIQAQIDLNAILHNYSYTKKLTQKQIISVVKADAYGHGAVQVARKLEQNGADCFAVATIDEALELRQNGIKGSILVLGYVFKEHIRSAVCSNISLTAASLDFLQTIVKEAHGDCVRVHIKLNTGMNRTGFYISHGQIPCELKQASEVFLQNKNLIFEGLFSHFASAEDNDEFCNLQFNNYKIAEDYFKNAGLSPKIRHICNSAGLTKHPDMLLDAVRLGIMLYGCEGSREGYLPAMQFKARIVDIHKLSAGDCVSYGLTFTAEQDMTMAVISAGYADGFPRRLSGNNACVLCCGKRAPLIGRVCMDMSMIDISGIPEARVGDEITLWGFDGKEVLTCEEQAEKSGTISYELLCGVSKRVPRVYRD